MSDEGGEAIAVSRPGTGTSRPGSGLQPSRPQSTMSNISRPASGVGASRPVSGVAGSRPATGLAGSRPATGVTGSRPGTGLNVSRPTTGMSSRPISSISTKSSKAWNESETEASTPRSAINDDDDFLLIGVDEPEKGCWHSFSHCVGGMWSTREMSVNEDKEIFVRTTIRELVVYILFLTVLSIVTFGMTSPTHFYYTQVMTNLFAEQPQVESIDDFWVWMEGQFLDGIHWEYWYNSGDNRQYICPGGEESAGPCPVAPADRNVLFENRLLGLARIRQLRVQNQSCEIHPDFQNSIRNCWAPYSPDVEDTADFFPAYRQHTSLTAWSYSTAEQMEVADFSITGKVGTYSGNGAFQNLHSVRNESQAIVHELKENLWINRGTRAVMIDLTVYNANINLFCVVNFLFEFPATGGILPSATYKTVKLLRYVNSSDYFIMACEFIYIMFIFYYIVEEILEIYKIRCAYFTGLWNNLDIVVVILSLINQSLNIYTYFTVEVELKALLSEPDVFADFQSLGNASQMFKSFVAICVFFSWVKLFKYISFNKTMTQLASTLSRCAGDICGFGVMFFIVFFAFAQLGYLLFGTQVGDYSTFDSAIFTLLRTILGDFDFNSMEKANRILGPIFFLCYVFFVFFVLLNMFLAIINDTYSEVKAEIAAQRNEFELGDYMKRGYNNMLGKVGLRNKLIDIENALKLANADGQVTYEEVRQNLKKCNFSDMEIEMFFAKYDVDGDGIFSWDEGMQIINDLDNDTLDSEERPKSGKEARQIRSAKSARSRPTTDSAGTINHEEFGMLTKRVDRMEGVIGSIVSKIDAVLIKLESMEKSKSKRKANISKILDGFTMEDEDENRPGKSGGED